MIHNDGNLIVTFLSRLSLLIDFVATVAKPLLMIDNKENAFFPLHLQVLHEYHMNIEIYNIDKRKIRKYIKPQYGKWKCMTNHNSSCFSFYANCMHAIA